MTPIQLNAQLHSLNKKYDAYNMLDDITVCIANNLANRDFLNCGLLAGDFSKIIYLYYYSKYNRKFESIADLYLQKLFDTYRNQYYALTYCNGIAGFGIGLDILEQEKFILGASDTLSKFDQLLSNGIKYYIQTQNIDFLHGLVGIGFYFLKRIKKFPNISCQNLTKIVDYLYSTAIIKRKTNTNYTVNWIFDTTDITKRYNISLSHGISSIAVLLCKIISLDMAVDLNRKCRFLIDGISVYLSYQAINPLVYGSFFPMFPKENGRPIYKSRLAWCYGDLGIALALRNIANVISDSSLMLFSDRVFRFAAVHRNNANDNMVYDAGICHGAAGIAQCFRLLFYQTNEVIFQKAYLYWYDIMLSMAVDINGYLQFPKCNITKQTMIPSNNLLEGNAGCGLVLLKADNILNQILLYE